MKKSAKFVVHGSGDGKLYFTLVAPNSEVIATSEMYTRLEACMKGIRAVKKYSKIAKVDK